jgi:hypothetical protein
MILQMQASAARGVSFDAHDVVVVASSRIAGYYDLKRHIYDDAIRRRRRRLLIRRHSSR